MDAHCSSPGDLNELERRLSAMRPSEEGMDAGKMLFAAGRASVRPGWGRMAWPVSTAFLAMLVLTLGVGLERERAARLDLDAQLVRLRPAVVPAPSVEPESTEVASDSPTDNSYLGARRTMLLDMDAGPVLAHVSPTAGPSTPSQAILKMNSHIELLEP
jgi:hypothetical protein